MGLATAASDWQVFGRVSVAGGLGISAGFYVWDFYSATAGISAVLGFHGVGLGEGGNLGSIGAPDDVGPLTAWSQIDCDQPFSVYNLNGAWGRITALGGAVGAGYSAIFISAAPEFWSLKSFFHSQYVGGISLLSVGGGGQSLIGGWTFKHVSNNVPGPSSPGTAVA
jgi:hypothetical protein